MWQKLLEVASQVVSLARDTRENREEIKRLRDQLNQTTLLMERVLAEFQRHRENEAHEREKNLLRLENELLRFKEEMRTAPKALPPGDDSKPS